MNKIFSNFIFLTLLASMMTFSCGKKDDSDAAPGTGSESNELAEDSDVSANVIYQVGEEGLASLNEEAGNGTAALTRFRLRSSFSRECTESDDKATVNINGSIDRDDETIVDNSVRKIVRSISGENEQTRVWSKTDDEIGCDGEHAEIDWSEVDGLELQVDFVRTREKSLEVTNKRRGVTTTFSTSFEATGTRTISWLDDSEGSDSSSVITRKKTIESDVTREFSVTNKKGKLKSYSLNVKTDSDTPLAVTVERNASDLSLVSKKITDGILIATNDDESRVETEFKNVLINYEEGVCLVESGSIVSAFFAEAATEATVTYTTTFSDGTATVVDADGVIVNTYDFNECDPEDFSVSAE